MRREESAFRRDERSLSLSLFLGLYIVSFWPSITDQLAQRERREREREEAGHMPKSLRKSNITRFHVLLLIGIGTESEKSESLRARGSKGKERAKDV